MVDFSPYSCYLTHSPYSWYLTHLANVTVGDDGPHDWGQIDEALCDTFDSGGLGGGELEDPLHVEDGPPEEPVVDEPLEQVTHQDEVGPFGVLGLHRHARCRHS